MGSTPIISTENRSSGGIGIHATLKMLCRKACGFESHLDHVSDNKFAGIV